MNDLGGGGGGGGGIRCAGLMEEGRQISMPFFEELPLRGAAWLMVEGS